MTLQACLECGELCSRSRCDDCYRPQDRPTARQKGYDSAWDDLSKRARRLQPWCTDCGTTEDLTTDHSPAAWARKAAGKSIRLSDVEVVCRSCNGTRGAARGRSVEARPTNGQATARHLRSVPTSEIASSDQGRDPAREGFRTLTVFKSALHTGGS